MPRVQVKQLQENLRKALWQRLWAGELTQLKLAEQTGFRQAHISNFLSRKRSLSLEGIDQILAAMHLSIFDLLDSDEINKRASILPPAETGYENVPLVDEKAAAATAVVSSGQVRDVLKFKRAFLRRLRPNPIPATTRANWRRFVLIKVDANEAAGMYPRLLPGATVLLDRHYNSLEPYRRGEPNLYAVRKDGGYVIRYVELSGRSMVLRPHEQDAPVEVMETGGGTAYAELIVGRVSWVGAEV
jgi:transcriptional regulator with XRE-family HTH domain